MAIYHLNAQIVKRSAGASAVAGAAYRAGERLVDERTGEVHDYRRKAVDDSVILTPAGAPAWTRNRAQLWNRAEAAERRADAQVAREVRVAIPGELSASAGRGLVRKFAEEQFVDRGMIADIGFHGEGGRNPHAHLLLTMRPIDRDRDGFSKRKDRSWNDKSALMAWREAWSDLANRALGEHGSPERIDHRTLEAQRIDAETRGDRETAIRLDRPPTMKRGRVLTHRPEAAPDRGVVFADAEAERAAAVRRAEEIIRIEARVAGGTEALDRLAREHQAEQRRVLEAVPPSVRAEARRTAAAPPAEPPPRPAFDRAALVAERDRRAERHRVVAAVPPSVRAEVRRTAAAPPAEPPPRPAFDRAALVAERDRRAERHRVVAAVPPSVRAEARRTAAAPPAEPPPRPAFDRAALVAERDRRAERHRVVAAVPPSVRAEARRTAAAPPAEPPPRPAFDRAALVAERDRRAERHQRPTPPPAEPAAPPPLPTADVVAGRAHDAVGPAAADLAARQPAGLPWREVRKALGREHETGGGDRYIEIDGLDDVHTAGYAGTLDVGRLRRELEERVADTAASMAPRRAAPLRGRRVGEATAAAVCDVQDTVDRIIDQARGRVPAGFPSGPPSAAEPSAAPGRADTAAAAPPPPPPSPAAGGTAPAETPPARPGFWRRFVARVTDSTRTETAPLQATDVPAPPAAEPASTPTAPTPGDLYANPDSVVRGGDQRTGDAPAPDRRR